MAYSSILGADEAPEQPDGRDAERLGPSDNSDTGSDTVGAREAYADSDSAGTGERASVTPTPDFEEGADILPDRVLGPDAGEESPEDSAEARELTDLEAPQRPDDPDEDAGAS